MRSLAVASLSEEALEVEVKSGAKIPDKDQAKPVEGKLTIPDESRSRGAMTANELRVFESACERSKDGGANFRRL